MTLAAPLVAAAGALPCPPALTAFVSAGCRASEEPVMLLAGRFCPVSVDPELGPANGLGSFAGPSTRGLGSRLTDGIGAFSTACRCARRQ